MHVSPSGACTEPTSLAASWGPDHIRADVWWGTSNFIAPIGKIVFMKSKHCFTTELLFLEPAADLSFWSSKIN